MAPDCGDPGSAGDVDVAIRVLPEGEGLPLPSYMSPDAAGCDLYAAVRSEIVLEPGARALIPAGFSIELPSGYEAQVRPRSGLALKHGVTCLNTPGTIDADYRGPVAVILVNHGQERFVVRRARFVQAESLTQTARASGGFGSTGTRRRP